MADSTSSNREVAKSTLPVQNVGISENNKSVIELGSTNVLEDSAQETINVSDTSKREVAGSPLLVGNSENSESVIQPDSTCNSLEDSTEEAEPEAINVLQQIVNDNGEFVKDLRGRFRVVYKDDNKYEIKTFTKRVEIKADGYSSEFIDNINKLVEGVKFQIANRYPFTVARNNNEHDSITTSESNNYREYNEYIEITPDEKTPLHKHLKEYPAVRLVRDQVTGLKHICKTNIISHSKCTEVQAMLILHNIAPEIYVVNRDGDNINLHMELIKGKRLDIVAEKMKAKHMEEKYMWPLCLYIFSDILYAINKLMSNDLSHGDIHTKNIIMEVLEEGQFRIRLIDYGNAYPYTISSPRNDMKSLVATLLNLFTNNHFGTLKVDEFEWLENNYEKFEKYPKLWNIFQKVLDVNNGESLKQFTNHVADLLVNNSKNPEFNKRREEIAKLLEE